MGYRTFISTWWKENPEWPNGLEPCFRLLKTKSPRFHTEEEARAWCRDYNATHPPGRLSKKAEYREEIR